LASDRIAAAAAIAAASPRSRGAMHQARQVGHAMDLGGPFDEGPRQRGQVGGENRLGDDVILILLAGGEQDGRARLLGVVEHAHGVAEAGRDVEIDDRELAGGLRIAIRHRHDRGLLQAEHIADIGLSRERVHQLQFGCAGIAEHDLHALLLQQVEEGALSGHDRHGVHQSAIKGEATAEGWLRCGRKDAMRAQRRP